MKNYCCKFLLLTICIFVLQSAWCQSSVSFDNTQVSGDGVTQDAYKYGGRYSGDVIIPDSITRYGYIMYPTSIKSGAFYCCYNLTSVQLPSTIKTIYQDAFVNCPRLSKIICCSPIPPKIEQFNTFIANKKFAYNSSDDVKLRTQDDNDVYTYAVLHVPMGSKEAYASAFEWRNFKNIKEDMQIDGNVYYANLTVKQGTTGYTQQAVKADETYTVYIGSLGPNRINSVMFNGCDVTSDVNNGYYTTPEIKGESVLSVSYEITEVDKVHALALSEVKVSGDSGEICISNIDSPSNVLVYASDGKLVDRNVSVIGSTTIPVQNNQMYLVKVGERTFKIAM